MLGSIRFLLRVAILDLLRKMNEIALLSYSLDLVNIPIQIFHWGQMGGSHSPRIF